MSFCVCHGAILQCPFGNAPSTWNVLPNNMVNVTSKPMATILDNKPFVNIMPFGMCISLSNPTVASATASAGGVLTPMPCVPVLPSPWIMGSNTVLLKNISALTDKSTLMCAYGGVIKCNFSGQITAQLK